MKLTKTCMQHRAVAAAGPPVNSLRGELSVTQQHGDRRSSGVCTDVGQSHLQWPRMVLSITRLSLIFDAALAEQYEAELGGGVANEEESYDELVRVFHIRRHYV